jgi:CheY-like chemotaxis protein
LTRRVFSLRGDSSGGFEADDRPTEILPVEDNEDDGMRTRLAFEQSGLHSHLHHAKDGEAGMAFLRKQTAYTDVSPNLILLDLNMLPKDGREVLAEIAADETLCQMPVVILTISSQEQKNPQDISASGQLLYCQAHRFREISADHSAAA